MSVRHRILILLPIIVFMLGFLFASWGFVSAEEKPSAISEFLNTKYKDKTNRQWLNYFLPYFAPTEAELKEQLKKDPKRAAFYDPETSIQQAPLPVQKLSAPVSEKPPVPYEPISTRPEGALMAVRIPKGVSSVPSPVDAQGSLPKTEPEVVPDVEKPARLDEPSLVPASSAKPIVVEPVVPKIPEKSPYIGIWTGQYSKLIEYYDPNTKSWKASENSLRDVPVELKLDEKGLLVYKMPERQGSATYVLKDDTFSIVCEDVRVRGDYFIEQESPQNLHLTTSRELVKDKMRVSLEFELLLKQ